MSLGVAVEPWVYKAGLNPGLPGAHRTAGPRVVILQVVEGERNGGWEARAARRGGGAPQHSQGCNSVCDQAGRGSGSQALQVSLGVAVEPWVYKAGLNPGLPGAHRTTGPRVVILQVVEGACMDFGVGVFA